ncbi:acyltransferase [Galliscardovia ingluviei]|uniref:acyltransferase n=1 Tax=Galliscardovia ingluviei TaxID=1769422 RepID=UPI00166D1C10|nr:acyltransferase [Galliscardovia ingluviei]
MTSVKRIFQLDVIRSFAIICVVFNHATEYSTHYNSSYLNNMPLLHRLIEISFFTFGRLGVPLFLMLTGYLLLDRDFSGDNGKGVLQFYRKNLLPLIIAWQFWILLYEVFDCIFYQHTFSVFGYLARALLIAPVNMAQAWYIPMIIGIYVLLPFVSIGIHSVSNKALSIITTAAYCYVFIVPTIQYLDENIFSFNTEIISQVSFPFSGGIYGIYVVLGFLAKSLSLKLSTYSSRREAVITILLVIFAVSAFIGTVLYQNFLFSRGVEGPIWYSFFTLPLVAVCIFLVLYRVVKLGVFSSLVTNLSRYSFGIFLMHMLIILPLEKHFPSTFNRLWTPVLFSAITIVVCYFVCAILARSQKLRWLILAK